MIQIKDIYLIGALLSFGLIGFNIWNFVLTYAIMNLPSKLSYIFGSILFQILFLVFFIVLYFQTPRVTKMLDNNEIEDLIKTMKGGY